MYLHINPFPGYDAFCKQVAQITIPWELSPSNDSGQLDTYGTVFIYGAQSNA